MYLCTRNYDLKRGGTFETAKAGTFHSVTAGTLIPLSPNYWAANRKPDILYIQNEAKKDASYTYWHVEYILKKYILEMQYVAVKAMLDSNVNIDEEIEKVNKLYMFDDVMKNRLTDQDSHLREKAHQYYDNWEIPGFCYQSKVWLDVFYDGVHTSTILGLPGLELSQKLRAKIEGRRKNQ